MNSIASALARTAEDLDALGAGWALVGGFAVAVRSEPRFTRDVDVVVAVAGDEEAEDVVRALLGRGYGMLGSIDHEPSGRLASVRLTSTVAPDVVVDLLFASSGIEPEISRDAEIIEVVPGLELPVAALGHLVALKLLARDDKSRPQDAADLSALRPAASEADVEVARDAVRLIEDRGFNRARDLALALESWLN